MRERAVVGLLAASLVCGCGAGVDAPATPAPVTRSAANSSADADPCEHRAGALQRPFADSSPWNTRIDARAADPRSRAWIANATRRVGVVAVRTRVGTTERRATDRLYVNTCAWTPAIVATDPQAPPVRLVCRRRDCGSEAATVRALRIPRGVDPSPQYDGWYSVIDEAAGVGYDLWRARRAGDTISYQLIKRWALDGPGFSDPASVGARGSGLPLFAGVIGPEELRRGRIDHALAISVPGAAQRAYVRPASATNGVSVVNSLPEGARLRLKRDVALGRGRAAGAIATALRRYGAIVVDRSITPTLYARRGDYGGLLRGDELRSVRLSDLEVLRAGPLLRFPPEADA